MDTASVGVLCESINTQQFLQHFYVKCCVFSDSLCINIGLVPVGTGNTSEYSATLKMSIYGWYFAEDAAPPS